MKNPRWQCLVLVPVLMGSFASLSQAMPNFARRSSMACEGCHTVIPRLNETGFQFRKAGFRMPDEIGKDSNISFKDTFAGRIQARYDYKHRTNPGLTATTKSSSNQLTFHEVTLYPVSGAFFKNYGSLMELSILSEDFIELENAYFRYAHGTDKAFFSARAGIFHPFEGYGASDRPYSINRPFIQRVVANQNGSTFFTPWGFDEAGLELAYVHDRSSISATLFNGIFVTEDEGAFKAFPAAGGELQRPTSGFENKDKKDFQLFLNQILKEDGSGLSLYWYHGWTDLPIPGIAPANFAPDSSFGNSFDRGAVYGSWMLTPKLGAQGAFQIGRDHFFDAATGSSDETFDSRGWFAELDGLLSEYLTVGARYDWFDPSKDVTDNLRTGVTAFANIPMNDGLQWIGEFQHAQQQRAALDDLKDDNFQLRLIWIW